MPDLQTLETYNNEAFSYATEWQEQPAPTDMYDLLLKYFHPGPTADIGCGSGRDIAWLSSKGFEVAGFDASEGLLEQARTRYPSISFTPAALPGLEGIPSDSWQNVVCETVIMHLDPDQIPAAVRRLLDILKTSGVLYLSWRVTEGETIRDKAGRLYSAFKKELVTGQLGKKDRVLFDRENISASSGRKIHRLIVQKG